MMGCRKKREIGVTYLLRLSWTVCVHYSFRLRLWMMEWFGDALS